MFLGSCRWDAFSLASVFLAVRPNFEEGGTAPTGRKHEFIRSESENWRIFREEQNGEDDDGGWRLAGSRRDGERWRPHSPGEKRSRGKCSCGYRGRAVSESEHGEHRGKGGEIGKVHAVLVVKYCLAYMGLLLPKLLAQNHVPFVFNVSSIPPYVREQCFSGVCLSVVCSRCVCAC